MIKNKVLYQLINHIENDVHSRKNYYLRKTKDKSGYPTSDIDHIDN